MPKFAVSKGIFAILSIVLLAGCVSPQGDTVAAKKQNAQLMRNETLVKLYAVAPQAREQIQKSEGYAVFSNVGVNLVLLSAGNGWGLVRDNKSGKDIHMRMASAGVGLGLGAKDFRGVFVFTKRDAMESFIEHGWDASGQADAAAISGSKGKAYAGAIDVAPGIKLYQITETGLALQATIQGTKYWKDRELNG